jgi:filamentous hemagglutinin family protein
MAKSSGNFIMMNHFSLKGLVIVSSCLLAISNMVIPCVAQSIQPSSIEPDGTLGLEKSIVTDVGQQKILITGGAERGNNLLFHSFENFSVDNGKNVVFLPDAKIENIISRVTGNSISNISGNLGVEGNANLFLINPNGVIFNNGASLDLKGSFFASTADSLVFDNAFEFSASGKQVPPTLLKVSLPIGFRFGATSANIVNKSDLQVTARNFVLLGGEVRFRDFNQVLAPGTNIEIGSVSPESLVSISLSSSKFLLNYKDVKEFQNIYISQGFISTGDENGRSSGNIQLSGENIEFTDGAQIGNFNDGNAGGDISINASKSLLIIDKSSLNTGINENGSVIGDIVIKTNRLILGNSSFIDASNDSKGKILKPGNINIDANDSINVFGNSQISSQSFSENDAGNVNLKSARLFLRNGGQVSSTSVFASNGGNIDLDISELIEINGKTKFATSGLFARSNGGNAGNIIIKNTKKIDLLNGGKISVSSKGAGSAGNINVDAGTILLDNGGQIEAITNGGRGDILLDTEKLTLRNNSLITTNANNSADGGNIKITTAILLALSPAGSNGSDITAKAIGGTGGKITITAQGIFGIEARQKIDGNQTNDIDASSQFGRSGQVDINTATNPNNGLTQLPETVIDPETQVAQSPCNRGWGNELTVSGRGGLPPSPRQDLSSEATQVKLVEPVQASNGTQNNPVFQEKNSSLNSDPEMIAPAQGWIYNDKGQVLLVAYNPTVTGPQRLKSNSPGCPVP